MAGKSSAFLIFANLSGKAISEGLGCCLNSCSAVIPRFPGRFHRQIQYPARQRDEDIPSQIAIPRPICAHARIWLMKINRGIIIARQRESRGGNNLFSRYNTPAAIPSRATVNWACDQHPIERQARRRRRQVKLLECVVTSTHDVGVFQRRTSAGSGLFCNHGVK